MGVPLAGCFCGWWTIPWQATSLKPLLCNSTLQVYIRAWTHNWANRALGKYFWVVDCSQACSDTVPVKLLLLLDHHPNIIWTTAVRWVETDQW